MQNSIDAMKDIVDSSSYDFKLEIQSKKWEKETNLYSQFIGEVKNISSEPLQVVAIVTLRDKNEELVASEDALIDFQPILPGQTSPFKIIARNNPAIEHAYITFKESGGGEIKSYTKGKKPTLSALDE